MSPKASLLYILFWHPTVFVVQVDLHFPLLGAQQGLSHLGNGQPLGFRSVQEVTGARLLHDLCPRVTTHVAEAIVAEDDGAVLHSCIGNDKLTTCDEKRKRFLMPQKRKGSKPQTYWDDPTANIHFPSELIWPRLKLFFSCITVDTSGKKMVMTEIY